MPPDTSWLKQRHVVWWDDDEGIWVCPVCPFYSESDVDAEWHQKYGREAE